MKRLLIMAMVGTLTSTMVVGCGNTPQKLSVEAKTESSEDTDSTEPVFSLTADTSDDVDEDGGLLHPVLTAEVSYVDDGEFTETQELHITHLSDEESVASLEEADEDLGFGESTMSDLLASDLFDSVPKDKLDEVIAAIEITTPLAFDLEITDAGNDDVILNTTSESDTQETDAETDSDDSDEYIDENAVYKIAVSGETVNDLDDGILLYEHLIGNDDVHWDILDFNLEVQDDETEEDEDIVQVSDATNKTVSLVSDDNEDLPADLSLVFESPDVGRFLFVSVSLPDLDFDDDAEDEETEETEETPIPTPTPSPTPTPTATSAPATVTVTPSQSQAANQTSGQRTTPAPVQTPTHVHTWVHHDAVYNTIHHDSVYKTVHHDAVYNTVHHDSTEVTYYVCNHCGIANPSFEHLMEFDTGEHTVTEGSPAYDEQVLISDAYDEQVLVSGAWDEQVLVSAAYDECSGCGAIK